jgi:hypothetical protein
VAVAAFIGIASASAASANPLGRNGLTFQQERMARRLAAGVTPNRPPAHSTPLDARYAHGSKGAGTWQSLAATSPFTPSDGAGTELLMTDGTIMVQNNQNLWYRLTPDLKGSYANGTWTEAASMGTSYGPLYFASAVLPDGRMLVEGGEYNFFKDAETNLGAIFDPVANTWTSVSPPSGWHSIGDASSVVLPSGTLMLGNCCYAYQALYGEASSTWTQTGTGKHDQNSEEGWTLLPNGQVLTEDVVDAPYSELYNPSTGAWTSAGNLPANLTQSTEIGPSVLRPDGTVFVSGANGLTAIYDTKTGSWSSGPTYPTVASGQLDMADGPASVLPDGNVLVATSPGVYSTPAYFFEFNGKKFISAPATAGASGDSSYNIRLLLLPTGQVLETDSSTDVEIYTPKGKAIKSIRPTIKSVPTTLTHGTTYTLSGRKLNGATQDNFYGDDDQQATNFPLVQITNDSTGDVFYARTHNFSAMPVASNAIVSTQFDVPSGIELGQSSLVVVTNGISSAPVAVMVQ